MVSAFVGFVLNLCHDLSCLMTGSRFWYFCNSFSVTFSVCGKKYFRLLLLIVELYRVGHEDQKIDSLFILGHLLVVLINLYYQLNVLFLLKGNDLFCVVIVLFFFVGYCFLSNVNMELV